MNNKVVTEQVRSFMESLNNFNAALVNATEDVEKLVATPGFEGVGITEKLNELSNKTANMKTNWSEIHQEFQNSMAGSMEEIEEYDKRIQSTLESR